MSILEMVDPREMSIYYYPTEYQKKRLEKIHGELKLNADPIQTDIVLRTQKSSGIKYSSRVELAAKERPTAKNGRRVKYYIDYVQGDVNIEAIVKEKGRLECIVKTGHRSKKQVECTIVPRHARSPYGGAIKPNEPGRVEKLKHLVKRGASGLSRGLQGLNCFSSGGKKVEEMPEKKVYYDSDSEYAESAFDEKERI